MKKFAQQIQKLASKFHHKYAQTQGLKEIIEGAAGFGLNSSNGIMNFMDQLKRDQADLYLTVTIKSKIMGGRIAEVGPLLTDPREVAGNYAKLPEQVENYLNKHLSNFPQIQEGTVTLSWSGKSTESRVAQR